LTLSHYFHTPPRDSTTTYRVMRLYACGSNGAGQLSLHHHEDVSTLMPCEFHPSLSLPADAEIIDLVSSSTHSLLLVRAHDRNILLGAGTNTLGQLGPRCALWDEVKPETRFKPVNLAGSAGLQGDWEPIKIAASWTTSFVVYRACSEVDGGSATAAGGSSTNPDTAIGTRGSREVLLACGSDDFGELGRGGPRDKVSVTRPSDSPVEVDLGLEEGDAIDMLRAGQRHIVAVISGPNGQRMVGWGASRKGELDCRAGVRSIKAKGKTAYPPISAPVALELDFSGSQRIVDVRLGASHTVVLLSNGEMRAWGSDLKGQIDGLSATSGIRSIAATWGGSYVLDDAGRVWSQGSNTHGQLCRIAEMDPRTARGEVAPGDVISGVEEIVTGSEHLMALVSGQDGQRQLYAGGWNEHGNLGVGDQVDRASLQQVDVPGQIKRVWGGLAATWVWVEDS